MKSKSYKAEMENVTPAMNFIEDRLTRLHISRKNILSTMLIAEESMSQLIENAGEEAVLSVSIQERFLSATVYISAEGRMIDSDLLGLSIQDVEPSGFSEQDLRAMMLRAYSNDFAYNCVDGHNHIMIRCGKTQRLSRTNPS